jgi:pimeloyl-ACP methyl ester carboxylesterase
MTADSWIALPAKNDVRVRYRRAGQGPTVLILHGWGASIEAVRILFEDLASAFDTVALDFPGHGQSPPPAEPWTVSDYRDLVLLLMDKLGITSAMVVAHSFGARVAIKLAAAMPQRINRMVLTGAAGVPPERTVGQRARMKLARIGKRVKGMLGDGAVSRWLETRWVHYVASADYARASGVMRATVVNVVGEDLSSLLPRVQSPVLLIWGAQDKDTPLSSGRVMAGLIPHSELVVLEGGGHFVYAEQFSKFRLHMRRFLEAG